VFAVGTSPDLHGPISEDVVSGDHVSNAVYCPSRKGPPQADEELAASRIGSSERAIEITPRMCGRSLNSAGIAYPGSPVPQSFSCGLLGEWVAALNHEIAHHPVEAGAIAETGAGEFLEIGDGVGRDVRPEGNRQVAEGSLEKGDLLVGGGRGIGKGAASGRAVYHLVTVGQGRRVSSSILNT
jgi:hypothetical protein